MSEENLEVPFEFGECHAIFLWMGKIIKRQWNVIKTE